MQDSTINPFSSQLVSINVPSQHKIMPFFSPQHTYFIVTREEPSPVTKYTRVCEQALVFCAKMSSDLHRRRQTEWLNVRQKHVARHIIAACCRLLSTPSSVNLTKPCAWLRYVFISNCVKPSFFLFHTLHPSFLSLIMSQLSWKNTIFDARIVYISFGSSICVELFCQ